MGPGQFRVSAPDRRVYPRGNFTKQLYCTSDSLLLPHVVTIHSWQDIELSLCFFLVSSLAFSEESTLLRGQIKTSLSKILAGEVATRLLSIVHRLLVCGTALQDPDRAHGQLQSRCLACS